MTWAAGEQILWTYPGEVRPATVVADDGDGLVLWLAPGTELLASVHLDGTEFRSRPLEERFLLDRSYALRSWRGCGILALFAPGAAHSLWLFRHDDGSLWGWYGNLEEPVTRSSWGIGTRDHVLDVWLDAQGAVHWKDEDELEEVVRIGRFTEDEAAAIRAEGQRVHDAMSRRDPPFDGRWLDWQPHPAWPLPVLTPALRALVGRRRSEVGVLETLG